MLIGIGAIRAQPGDHLSSITLGTRALLKDETCVGPGRERGAAARVVWQALAATEIDLRVRDALWEDFKSAQLTGHRFLFSVLGQAEPTLAGIDDGQTLWQVYKEVVVVENWWGV